MTNSLAKVEFEEVFDADGDTLAELRVAAMRDSLERVGRFDPTRARDRFLSAFDPAFTRHIVVDGARVGFFVLRPVEAGLLLDHLYIDPRYQGQGVGAAVLSRVLSEADRQCLDVRVGALKDSDANRFYVRHGFEVSKASEWDVYYVRRHENTA